MSDEKLPEVERVYNVIQELSRCVHVRGGPAFDCAELDFLKDFILRRTGTLGVGGCPNITSRVPLTPPTRKQSAWDKVGALFEEISALRGGPYRLYKPVVRIEYYEHDGIVNAAVGRCKGMDDIVARAQVWEDETVPDQRCAVAVLRVLTDIRLLLGECE